MNKKSEAAAILGSSKSDKKTASSRENGKLGGRPKGQKGKKKMEKKNFCENCGGNISHTAEKIGGHLNFCSQRCWEQALTRKIRRRIEDRLRKNTEDVFAVARLLGVSEEF